MKKKNRIWIHKLIITGFISILTNSCEKDDDNGEIIFNHDLSYGTVIDIDGNLYKTLTIGTQTWMAENLRTTKYNDGTAIPNVTSDTEWCALTTGAYCTYNNTTDADSIGTYGMLYTWYAVNTGKLAPPGWHVSTDADWRELTTYLGDERVAGGKLKEIGTTHWSSPNTSADNSSGFTALPSGARCFWGGDSAFGGLSTGCAWWSSDLWYGDVWIKCIEYNISSLYIEAVNLENRVFGFSVRCVKD